MNNNNLYSMNKFGEIPVRFFPTTPEGIEDDSLLICKLIDGYTDEEKGTRIEASKTLYIDNVKQSEVTDTGENLKEKILAGVEDLLQKMKIYTGERKELFFEGISEKGAPIVSLNHSSSNKPLIDTYMVLSTLGEKTGTDSRLISEYIYRDYLRMKAYNKKGSNKRDILIEQETDLQELGSKLLEVYYPKDPITKDFKRFDYDSKNLEKIIKANEQKIDEYQEEIRAIKFENKFYRELIKTYEDLRRISNEAGLEERQEIYSKPEERATKKAEIKAILQEHTNRREEQENTLQTEESLIPEEIQRKAGFYIEHGFIEEVKGAGHYKILRGLSVKQFHWIVQQVRNKRGNRNTLSIKELTSYVWKSDNEPYSEASYKAPTEEPKDKIMKEVEKLLSE